MVWVGLYTRDFNTIGLTSQLELKSAFRFGYSFELPTSANVETRYTTHEFSIILDFVVLKEHDFLERLF